MTENEKTEVFSKAIPKLRGILGIIAMIIGTSKLQKIILQIIEIYDEVMAMNGK